MRLHHSRPFLTGSLLHKPIIQPTIINNNNNTLIIRFSRFSCSPSRTSRAAADGSQGSSGGFREPLDTSNWKPRVNRRWTPMTIVLVSVPILTFALGTWQVQRLGWKKELIKDLENKMALEPIGLPKHINPKVIPEFEYRKVKLTGRFDHSKEIFIESRTREGELGYHLITPFHPHNGGQPILVNRGFIKRQLKDPRSRPLSQESKDVVEVIGMLRKQESKSFFQPNNSKDSNQWYFVDIQEIAEHLETAPILVDAITCTSSTFSSSSLCLSTKLFLKS
ncbi:surf-like protein [Puccinia graminis f. sp. tritici]|uniref:SURF1-like protein n=1 Tax=Puccinia graminis f. sp. tritici TaxID=56615 RepID=A0A5B0MNT3_PUCGR|nr:surf-like protein [Puccinia graminis f. sp. tritici]